MVRPAARGPSRTAAPPELAPPHVLRATPPAAGTRPRSRLVARLAPEARWRVAFVVAPWGWGTATLLGDVAGVWPRVVPSGGRAGPGGLLVADEPDEAVLAEAVGSVPAGGRLLVRARYVDPHLVRAARARGGVVSVGPERLALRPWEAADAFDPPLGALLPGPELDRLVALADGWPGVLRLVHETIRAEPAVVRLRAARALPPDVGEVLAAEVLAPLPPGLREFLRATAALPVLSAAACDAYLGAAGSAAWLRLAAAYGLLLPAGSEGASRLPHPLRGCLGAAVPLAHDDADLVVGPPGTGGARWAAREDPAAPPWLRRVASALRETPGYAAAPASGDPLDLLAAGVEALLAGRAAEALAALRQAAPGSVAAEVAAHVAAPLAGGARPAVPPDDLALAARRRGERWLADLADACDPAQAPRVAAHAWRSGSDWVAAAADLLAALHGDRAGLDRAEAFFARYGADVPRAWCAALAAGPETAADAVALAARAGSRGARAVALRAVDPPAAARLARESGLDLAFLDAVPPAPGVVVRCFGGLAVAGADLAALRPRARALLGLLAVRAGRPVHREVIAAALWPDVPGEEVWRRVHVAVSSVRRVLGRGAVTRDGDGYVLAAESDVRAFDDLAAEAARARGTAAERPALHGLLALYGGDLLPEAGPAEWVVPERHRRRSLAADAGERLAAVALADGDPGAAAAAARQGLRADPYRDVTWQALFAALAACGHPAALARARTEYAALLAEA